jgi:hypothetical protein
MPRYHYFNVDKWKYYQWAREKYLKRQRVWALIITIVFSLLPITLFFTLPSYKKIVARCSNEKKEMDEIRDKILANPYDSHYKYAMQLLFEEVDVKKAEQVLTTILLEHHNEYYYEEAASLLGHMYLAQGKTKESSDCFEKSGEQRAYFIAKALAENKDIDIKDLAQAEENNHIKNSASVSSMGSSSASHATLLKRSGIFSVSSSGGLAKIKGLDEEDDLESVVTSYPPQKLTTPKPSSPR